MTTPALLTLIVTIIVTLLLIGNWLRPDLVALLMLVVWCVIHLVTPDQALA